MSAGDVKPFKAFHYNGLGIREEDGTKKVQRKRALNPWCKNLWNSRVTLNPKKTKKSAPQNLAKQELCQTKKTFTASYTKVHSQKNFQQLHWTEGQTNRQRHFGMKISWYICQDFIKTQ